jgi:hypothetical protein
MSTTLPKKSTKFRRQFLLDFFVLLHFRVFLSDVSAFTKKTTKQSQTDFRGKKLDFFGTFWAFLGEGSSKTRQKISKKNWPWSFFGL